jgi:hypothetical protein
MESSSTSHLSYSAGVGSAGLVIGYQWALATHYRERFTFE